MCARSWMRIICTAIRSSENRLSASSNPEQKLQNELQNDLCGSSFVLEIMQENQVAGGPGFEPRLTESESAVLPLNYPPAGICIRLQLGGPQARQKRVLVRDGPHLANSNTERNTFL